MSESGEVSKLVEVLSELAAENAALAEAGVEAIAREVAADEQSNARTRRARLEALLGDALIVHETASPELLERIEEVLPAESIETADVETLRREAFWAEERLCVWHGDVTRLAVDAIVNAANDEGLGCFVPSHRCVDNVVHRAAGPRLRAECVERMRERPGGFGSLVAGSAPIATKGYRLPAKHVLHATGPRVESAPTAGDARALAACYERCLDLALARGFESIAFPCLSTGLFGYPSAEAARVALAAVRGWLAARPEARLVVVLDVFADGDARAYERELIGESASPLHVANAWLREAEAVVVCAGAGMSGNPGEMVYTDETDFAEQYPWLVPLGYRTAYECMGLLGDATVPDRLKRAYLVKHAHNQRYRFAPNPSYAALLDRLAGKDYFVYTSNVDGNFLRAGFDADRIYTPQGDWAWFQCELPCRRDSYWPALPDLERLLPLVPDLPDSKVPRCPNCGRKAVGNVRGGSWFTHAPHDDAQDRFAEWIERRIADGKNLVVLEIGVGFNTPTVTRLPMEQICRDHPNAKLVRVNPNDSQVPVDLDAVGLPQPWSADLAALLFAQPSADSPPRNHGAFPRHPPAPSRARPFNWRAALCSLRR